MVRQDLVDVVGMRLAVCRPVPQHLEEVLDAGRVVHVGVHREPVELLLAPQERELEVAVVLVARERAAAASSLSGSCSTPRDGLNVLRSANAGTATNTSIGISSTRVAWIAIPTIISPNGSSDADATVCSIQAVPNSKRPPASGSAGRQQSELVLAAGRRLRPEGGNPSATPSGG